MVDELLRVLSDAICLDGLLSFKSRRSPRAFKPGSRLELLLESLCAEASGMMGKIEEQQAPGQDQQGKGRRWGINSAQKSQKPSRSTTI